MMYNQKLVACVKSNGQILREFGDIVYLPFQSEYSILLKNMNSVRAEVGISIDGKDVLNGSKLIIDARSTLELERFLENNSTGHKFKFIERTSAIENHRGIDVEDGLIRVEYKYERIVTYPYNGGYNNTLFRGVTQDSYYSTNAVGTASCQANISTQAFVNDVGITGKGSISNQKFQTVSSFQTELETHVIVLQLKGDNQGAKITKAVDVSRKQKCDLCGKNNKATAKFCQECGNSLEVLI